MRGLLKILMVAAFVALFAAAAYGLSNWWGGAEKTPAVVVEIEPPPRGEQGVIPLRGRVVLYAGEPRMPTDTMVPVDESEDVDLERQEVPRLELNADRGDGTKFFVYGWMELSNFDILCDTVALPPLRHEARGESGVWVDARTGRPLKPVRMELKQRCDEGY